MSAVLDLGHGCRDARMNEFISMRCAKSIHGTWQDNNNILLLATYSKVIMSAPLDLGHDCRDARMNEFISMRCAKSSHGKWQDKLSSPSDPRGGSSFTINYY